METLGYWASDCPASPPDLLLPDLTPTLSVFGLASGLLLTSWGSFIPLAEATLSRGDRCDSVADLQNALISAGFDPGGVDGVFGGATEYAVMRFQTENQLTSDRIVGSATATALGLKPDIACTPTATSPTAQSPTQSTTETASSIEDEGVAVVSIPVRFGQVSTDGSPLNIRSGPSVDYAVVNTVANGTILRFVGQPVDAWLQLLDGGWIHSDWVTFVNAPETPSGTADQTTTKAENSSTENSTTAAAASNAATNVKSDAATNVKSDAASNAATNAASDAASDAASNAVTNVETNVETKATAVDSADSNASDSNAIVLKRVKVQTGGSPLNIRKTASYEAEITGQLEDEQLVTAIVPAGPEALPD